MKEEETEGVALAGMSLAFGVISRLQQKGLLTKEDVQGLFEGVLQSLEQDNPDPNSPGTRIARALVDAMAQVAATGGTMKPTGLR